MRKIFRLLALILVSSCGKANPAQNPPGGYWQLPAAEELPPSGYADRLVAHHTFSSGFVGSKGEFDGDSALFTGIAMGSIPCDKAEKYLSGFEVMSHDNDGGLIRNWPITREYIEKNNVYSIDQHVGVMFGVLSARRRCPQLKNRIIKLWDDNLAFIEKNGGEYLHPNATLSKINQPIRLMMDLVSGRAVTEGQIMDFEGILIGGALGIKASGRACYPVHLGTLAIVNTWLADRPISQLAMDAFCETTNGMDLPLTDYLCKRISGKLWLETYEPNKWEYRHQRCGGRESPDARADETHGVDYLIMEALVSKSWRNEL